MSRGNSFSQRQPKRLMPRPLDGRWAPLSCFRIASFGAIGVRPGDSLAAVAAADGDLSASVQATKKGKSGIEWKPGSIGNILMSTWKILTQSWLRIWYCISRGLFLRLCLDLLSFSWLLLLALSECSSQEVVCVEKHGKGQGCVSLVQFSWTQNLDPLNIFTRLLVLGLLCEKYLFRETSECRKDDSWL